MNTSSYGVGFESSQARKSESDVHFPKLVDSMKKRLGSALSDKKERVQLLFSK